MATTRTAVCLLTGPTRAAVATVAVDGPAAGEMLGQAFEPAGAGPIRVDQVRYGLWHGGHADCGPAESVVVTRSADRAGRSGWQSWEIHCHGGVVAAGRIIEDLRRLGADVLPADRWLRWREQPLLVREASEVLSRTTSPRTAAIALDQLRGAMSAFIDHSLQRLDDRGAAGVAAVKAEATERLRFAAVGLHLDRPWHVVLAGPPNVGKSSLINAILGFQRSITLDQPGTTRDVLEAQTLIEGWPIRLSDTAGIRDAAQCEIEHAGIELARRELDRADLVLWVQDASELATMPPAAVDRSRTGDRLLEVINKVDRLETAPPAAAGRVTTSATTGKGIDELRLQIATALVPAVPPSGSAVPITPRQVECLQSLVTAGDPSTMRAALAALHEDRDCC